MKNSPFLVQVETFLVCCIFTIVFVLEMCLLSLIHTFLYSLFLYESLHLLLIVLAFLVVFVKLKWNHSIYHQCPQTTLTAVQVCCSFFQMEYIVFQVNFNIKYDKITLNFSLISHTFLTPNFNFSYLNLKTFINEALIYHQWMCKVTWYFEMLIIMQADTYYQTSNFFL